MNRGTSIGPAQAARILGVDPGTDRPALRAAYRRQIRAHHPDRAGAGSSDQAVRIIVAYRVLDARFGPAEPTAATAPTAAGAAGADPGPRSESEPEPSPSEDAAREAITAEVVRLDADTIAIGAPTDEAFRWLLDAAHDLGEVTYLDRSGPILEVLCRFEDEPATSLVVTVQGRATYTEAFCTVESIEARPAPPASAVIDCYELALRRRQGFDAPAGPPG